MILSNIGLKSGSGEDSKYCVVLSTTKKRNKKEQEK